MSTNLIAKWVLSLLRPQSRANKAISSGYSAQNIEQKRDGVVGDVLRVCIAGSGDCDATATALGEVDVVDASTGAHDYPKWREEVEGFGSDGGGAHGDEGAYGGGGGGDGGGDGLVEQAEVGLQAVSVWEVEGREGVGLRLRCW
jgi:hypothetical protein